MVIKISVSALCYLYHWLLNIRVTTSASGIYRISVRPHWEVGCISKSRSLPFTDYDTGPTSITDPMLPGVGRISRSNAGLFYMSNMWVYTIRVLIWPACSMSYVPKTFNFVHNRQTFQPKFLTCHVHGHYCHFIRRSGTSTIARGWQGQRKIIFSHIFISIRMKRDVVLKQISSSNQILFCGDCYRIKRYNYLLMAYCVQEKNQQQTKHLTLTNFQTLTHQFD